MISKSFEQFSAAERVDVTDNFGRIQYTIHDLDAIHAFLEVLDGFRDGWDIPEGGIPVAPTRLNFYVNDQALGNVGIGRSFMAAHIDGGFWSRKLNEQDVLRLFSALEPLE